jgi:hypothetical protein
MMAFLLFLFPNWKLTILLVHTSSLLIIFDVIHRPSHISDRSDRLEAVGSRKRNHNIVAGKLCEYRCG